MFGIKDDVPSEKIEELKNGLLSLPKQIDVIRGFELGEDLKLPGGQSHPAGKNRSLCWSVWFASAGDYEAYDKHQAHVDVLNQKIKPILLPGSRAAVQYEISD